MASVEAPAVRQPRVSRDEDEPETCALLTHPNTGAGGAHVKPPRGARANAKDGEGIVPSVGKAGFQLKAVGKRPMRMSHVSSTSHHSLASLAHAREEHHAEDDNEELSPELEQQDASLGTAVTDAGGPDTRESTETPTLAPNDSAARAPHVPDRQIIQTSPRAARFEAPSSPGGTVRCTVDNCGEPCVSVYCRRYHTCREHIGALHVVRGGAEVRFCQRCSSFQPIADFDGDRHTCRDALHAYNSARREMRKTNKDKRKKAAAEAGEAPDGVKRGAKGAKKTRTEPAPSSTNNASSDAATAFAVDNRAIEIYRATMNALQATRAAPTPGAPPPPATTMTQLDAMRMMAAAGNQAAARNQAAALTGNGGDCSAQMFNMMQFMNVAWLQWCANVNSKSHG